MPTKQELEAAAKRLVTSLRSSDGCRHVWNCHRQCQWCHRMQKEVDAYDVAEAYLAGLRQKGDEGSRKGD